MTERLLIFAKNPELGKTKTRIGNKLGDDAALAVYYALIRRCQQVTAQLSCEKEVCYSSFIDHEDSWDDREYLKSKQHGADIGERMSNAIEASYSQGIDKVVLIGTDIYDLSAKVITDAFKALSNVDVVIGPAKDGGYYLIGMKAPHPYLFELSAWSTDTVCVETISILKQRNLTYTQVALLSDIDEPEDLVGTPLEHLLTK